MTKVVDDTAYPSAGATSSSWTTVADGHKFLVVRRLSRRLIDRSKNAILSSQAHLYLAPSLRVVQSEFHQNLKAPENYSPWAIV